MLPPRRLMPSLTALRAIDALARLGSATAVAEELGLTQSAVSRQLQALEHQLGAQLIARKGRGMVLTQTGQDYVTQIRPALAQISQAGLSLQMQPSGAGTVSLAILPTFGMRWLVPRLPEFTRRHPEVTINLSTCLTLPDFATAPYDAAIYFGAPDLPGCHSLPLRSESVQPVCAPDLLQRLPVTQPADILKLPLLHIQTRPHAWPEWLARHGLAAPAGSAMIFDQFSTITQAALHGLGAALLPHYLAEQDIATGRLVPVWGGPVQARGAYHLVWPRLRPPSPALLALRDWLATQSEDGDSLPR